MSSVKKKHHIVIIGGGPGGYEAALAGVQLGAQVTLIERNGVGGSAVLTDVVPSKALIATAEAASAIREATELGIRFKSEGKPVQPEVDIDFGAINQRLLEIAREQSRELQANLTSQGVRIIHGSGRLDGNHHVIATQDDGDEERIEAKTIIVAVGAHPRTIAAAAPDGERILTWLDLYGLTELPEHMIVVGSGVTGAEFASAFSGLGCQVTLVSSRETVLPSEDKDAAALIERVFKKNGMQVLSQARAESAVNTGSGVEVTLSDGRVLQGSHVLIAVGAIPNTTGLGLEEAGVELTESGHIAVNRVARTSRANVYAVGDCTNFLPLASVSAMQGRTAVFHTMGDVAAPTQLRNVAANVFTSPEIASVGWSQAAIENGEVQGSIHKIMLDANPRAKMSNIEDGFIKVFASTSGTVIGGVVVGPKASELIYPIALAVENRLTVDQVARTFAVYPSLSGSITEAARALHIPNV